MTIDSTVVWQLLNYYHNLTHANVWKPCSCIQFIKRRIFTTSYARIHISIASHMKTCISTTSHVRMYCKSHVLRLNMQWSQRYVWKIIVIGVPSYTGKKYYSVVALALLLMLCTHNNTDGNKLGDILYCDDTYIVSIPDPKLTPVQITFIIL